jgi:hypothetical protein
MFSPSQKGQYSVINRNTRCCKKEKQMGINFDKIKERLAQVQGKGKSNRSEIWWKPQDGEQTIRILPTKDEDPFKDFYFHYNMGRHSGFLCPNRNFGEDCPVCSFASRLWHDGDTDDKEMAKKLFVRQRFFSAVVERDGKEGLKFDIPKLWGYSKTVYEDLLKYCSDEDYGDITSITEGNDIKLTYSKAPGVRYPSTDVKVRPTKTKLCGKMKKEECDKILDSVPNFLDHMSRKTTKEVEIILNEWSHDDISETDVVSSSDISGIDYVNNKTAATQTEASLKRVSDNPVDKAFDELLD